MRGASRIRDALRGLSALSPASLELLARRPQSAVRLQSEVLRLRRALLGQGLPLVAPHELLEFEGEYTLRFGIDGVHVVYMADLFFVQIVAMLRPRRAFEIGTNIGVSTRMIAMYGPPELEIFTLDLHPQAALNPDMTDPALIALARARLGSLFKDTRYADSITQLHGDSMRFDFSPYRGSMDFVYVDGSHSYPYVQSDTRNAMAMIRPGGVIVWDDYGSVREEYGTTRYLEELRAGGIPVYCLGLPSQGGVPKLTNRAALRVSEEVLERFARGFA
jgi:hypothetical protein